MRYIRTSSINGKRLDIYKNTFGDIILRSEYAEVAYIKGEEVETIAEAIQLYELHVMNHVLKQTA